VPVDSSLRGIRVLDLSRILAAPWASQLLGDLGAEVVKVKRPRIGDEARGYGPPFPAALHHRDVHSGEGQYIDASLLECGVPALSHYAQNFLISGVC
jgi:crotonobetainyl-CoA:carnitine CoA-transferase CaiB-like acyl-CoA transferase